MSADSFLMIIDVAEPKRAGNPSAPEILDRVRKAITTLYIENGELPKMNLLVYSRSELSRAFLQTL